MLAVHKSLDKYHAGEHASHIKVARDEQNICSTFKLTLNEVVSSHNLVHEDPSQGHFLVLNHFQSRLSELEWNPWKVYHQLVKRYSVTDETCDLEACS